MGHSNQVDSKTPNLNFEGLPCHTAHVMGFLELIVYVTITTSCIALYKTYSDHMATSCSCCNRLNGLGNTLEDVTVSQDCQAIGLLLDYQADCVQYWVKPYCW